MTEVWKDIPGYEGRYQASSTGHVRSLDRYVEQKSRKGKTFQTFRKGRILTPGKSTSTVPYPQVTLYPEGATHLVHRLVLLTFVGPCPPGEEVRHLDGNYLNNSVDNLAYGTHTTNVRDTILHGRHTCKLTAEDVREVRHRILAGETNTAIGKAFGVSDVVISNIRLGRSYTWVT